MMISNVPVMIILKLISFILITQLAGIVNAYEVIYAINAGGEGHRDKYGIYFERDPLMGKVGTASDYGKQFLLIGRVLQSDEILYQTERYHVNTFGYDIPLNGDGEYALILKFCEVYFNGPNMKVFDVVLNGDHTVIADLDIYQQVGRGVAHDEYIYFSVSRGRLYYKEEESEIRAGKIRIEFIKGFRDNPKINAIALLKGNIDNIPKLPDINTETKPIAEQPKTVKPAETIETPQLADDLMETNDYEKPYAAKQNRKTSGPKQPNPYSLDDSSIMLPVFIAIGAFVPLLFCLCKL